VLGAPKTWPRTCDDGGLIGLAQTDWEPIQQHALSSITDCQIQMVAHRKQGPVLPTLVINVNPDPTTDKLRKRRSSRTAGLTTMRETTPTTLWFRPDKEQNSLPEWHRCIHTLMQFSSPGPLSPVTPGSPTFINPFSPRSREASDFFQRPGSGNPGARPGLGHQASTQTHSSRERPVTYSESPSLRSKRSDLSHASSMNPAHIAHASHNFMVPFPTDLPSPATTVAEYQGEFIEGWTTAQGRSSTLSSPVRGRDSVSSQGGACPPQPLVNSSSPPAPRETILDRAFQLRRIPGSERAVPGEEKLTSLARFDAIKREQDQKRRRPRTGHTVQAEAPKSGWDLDEDDEDDEDEDESSCDGSEDDEAHSDEAPGLKESVQMSRSAQQALHFIASRHDPAPALPPRRPQVAQTPDVIEYHTDSLRALNSGYSHLRPQTGYNRRPRTGITQRTHSQPQLAALATTTASSTLDVPSLSTSEDGSSSSQRSAEKRLSTSSTKRLSFTEFTKRLSSTSSLLLVQTNASTASSRGSGEIEASQQGTPIALPRSGQRGSGVTSPPPDWDKRCAWRGSVGVFGAEGGFL
jgi:hypothetical protein